MRRDGEGAADVPVELHLPKERGDEIVVGAVAENGGEAAAGREGTGRGKTAGFDGRFARRESRGRKIILCHGGGDVEFVEVGRSPICGT